MKFYKYLRKINFVLYFLNFITLAFLGWQFLSPELNLLFVKASDKTLGYIYKSSLASNTNGVDLSRLKPIPNENRLVIPNIHVNSIIFEGEDISVLQKGVWRRPNTSTPNVLGNTVLTAHRFLYTHGPNTFYHLDKVKLEDKIIVFWNQKEYIYNVSEIKEIEPFETYIEENYLDNVLTLYTCTPLYSASKRLVIIAKLI